MLFSTRLSSHFDGWHTMEGRHLVLAYLAVAGIQLGYAAWIGWQWMSLKRVRPGQ